MRVVIQRVRKASVTIREQLHSAIGQGLLILLGIECEDTPSDVNYLVKKIVNLRIFNDDNGVMNRSVMDINGEILCVSQFTLLATTHKGNRPSYIHAAKPEISIPLYEQFCKDLSLFFGKPVATGVFGADMQVELINDGPVTIWIDSKSTIRQTNG
ncbi:MAG: D-tyrosyl-tRNA(Tyr) deacylase [Candidatus Symbiothrix sp.]|nr:D-tyrosyl-tRNA(Tyr) deacylase [Candidatus Symbiothrix sp.]